MSRQLSGVATKRPIPIHFFRWSGYSESHIHELKAWITAFKDMFEDVIDLSQGAPRVLTLEGISYELPDNYVIIRGIQGEYYPCENQIFEDSYDYVDSNAHIIRT